MTNYIPVYFWLCESSYCYFYQNADKFHYKQEKHRLIFLVQTALQFLTKSLLPKGNLQTNDQCVPH